MLFGFCAGFCGLTRGKSTLSESGSEGLVRFSGSSADNFIAAKKMAAGLLTPLPRD
jgi:hypothetical protein